MDNVYSCLEEKAAVIRKKQEQGKIDADRLVADESVGAVPTHADKKFTDALEPFNLQELAERKVIHFVT